ncbi:hypothetical protein BGZ49_005488 [Haplosporangium sp. Z 27]|nr:hypothetical protein BGZ49_005488 [Haplosporangium sp. Z 27]
MTTVTDFRPVSHEFYPEEFHGAAFVGAKNADALWFYRFDHSFIEVRDIFTCQDKVYASLSTTDVKQRFSSLIKGNEIHFVNVQDAYVSEFHALIFVVREVHEDRDHVFIWNLLTFHLQLLVSPPRPLTAITVMAQQAIMVRHRLVKSWGKAPPSLLPHPSQPSHRPLISNGSWSSRSSSSSSLLQKNSSSDVTSSSIDLEEEDEDQEDEYDPQNTVRIQGNRRQLLVLGHRNGWVSLYKFTVSSTGQDEAEHQISLNNPTNASVTSLATLSNKGTGSTSVIVAGMSDANAYVINYVGARKKPQVLMALKDLASKTLPITSIIIEPTKDEALDILVVGQGYSPGLEGRGDCPTVTIYYLRAQRSDYRLLGYVEPQMLEGEVATGGKTLAIAVSEDINGLRIQCAFSIQVDQTPLRSELTTVEIYEKEVRHLDKVDMLATEGGTLLDISPQTNSYELMVLYLSKMVNSVHTADLEWNRKESEWAEGIEGQETTHRDLVPVYGSFFEEKSKFNYTDSELAEIEERRQQLGGKLFYDRLLEFVELEVGVLYPPKNHAQQRNLWTNIFFNGNLNADNRNCLAYYLLKNQHGDINEQFLKEYMIPPKFVDLMNGFWALDHFEFKNAVLYLSRPGLTVDWIEDVIEAIYKHGSPQLARQFLVASNLNLTSDQFVDLKMKILLECDFTEAFYYQRSETLTQRHHTRDADDEVMDVGPAVKGERLFTRLLDYCFLDKPNRKAIQVLSLLTMSEVEEQMFVRYCEQHSGLTREIGQEFLIMYYVNHSRYLEAIRMHRKLLASELEKENAEQFHPETTEQRNSRQLGGAKETKKMELTRSQKRQLLIDNLMTVLPETQRVLLELEEEDSENKAKKAVGNVGTNNSKTHSSSSNSTKSVVRSLMNRSDGPLISLKGLDLNWVTKSLTQDTEESAQGASRRNNKTKDNESERYLPSQLLPNDDDSLSSFGAGGSSSSNSEYKKYNNDATASNVEELEQFSDTSLPDRNGSRKDVSKPRETSKASHEVETMTIDSDDNL